MNSFRCSRCTVSWPHNNLYRTCPECGEQCDPCGNDTPLDDAEALSRKRRADFERWLDDNNRRDPVETLERIPTRG